MMHLVQEDIRHLARNKPAFQILIQRLAIREILIVHILEVDGDDLLFLHALLAQPILIHFQKSRLAASPDSCHDLDDLLVLESNQPPHIFLTLDHDIFVSAPAFCIIIP